MASSSILTQPIRSAMPSLQLGPSGLRKFIQPFRISSDRKRQKEERQERLKHQPPPPEKPVHTSQNDLVRELALPFASCSTQGSGPCTLSGQQVEQILLTRAWVSHEREIWCYPTPLPPVVGGRAGSEVIRAGELLLSSPAAALGRAASKPLLGNTAELVLMAKNLHNGSVIIPPGYPNKIPTPGTGSISTQQLDDSLLFEFNSKLQGRLALIICVVNVYALLTQEHLHQAFVFPFYSCHQGCLPPFSSRIGISPVVQQKASNLLHIFTIGFLQSTDQGISAHVVPGIDLCPHVNENTQGFCVAIFSSTHESCGPSFLHFHESCEAIAITLIDICSFREESLEQSHVSTGPSDDEGSGPILLPPMRVSTMTKQDIYNVFPAQLHCIVQRCPAPDVFTDIDVSPSVQAAPEAGTINKQCGQ
ncbi:hypothetical protein U0070_009746 [Myodes glareolus]|uniref:Uncharacterized protein n=1 Tax=Myodes glareolus TaxID=447135 RepID=A0AAW0JEC3_MYOGA